MSGGHRVHSAIVRRPRDGPLTFVPGRGIQGHESAAHNAEVYAFFAQHYDRWSAQLGIPRKDWDWCHWGENLTLRVPPGLDENSVRLGDRWEFAGGVHLEVCGARVPCSRLAWRLGQPDAWLNELASTGCCGVYLRVVRGGEIQAGDAGWLVQTRESAPCVATITRCAFAKDSPSVRSDIARLLSEDVLQEMNRGVMRAKQTMFKDQELRSMRGWKGWRPFRIRGAEVESADAKSFYLEPVDGKPLPVYVPGQFLTVRLPNNLQRCWSLSDWTSESEPPHYRITIKKVGPASTWLHEASSTDTLTLEACAPSGRFVVDRTMYFANRQVYISAGIGITPIFTMLQSHLTHPELRKAPAIWIHVTRDASTFVFRNQIPDLPRDFRKIIFFTRPRPGIDVLGRDFDATGRPDESYFKNLLGISYMLNPMNIKPIPLEGRFSHFYVCGPRSFEADVRAHLMNCRVPPSLVHSESFELSEGPNEVAADVERATVVFGRSGKRAVWSRDDPCFILELARRAGLEPAYGCTQGICGSCTTRLVKGNVSRGLQEDGESVHICVAYPATENVEVDL
jgi:ferredoxin-NADP reductase/MOSC domain-containing protein YiiM